MDTKKITRRKLKATNQQTNDLLSYSFEKPVSCGEYTTKTYRYNLTFSFCLGPKYVSLRLPILHPKSVTTLGCLLNTKFSNSINLNLAVNESL